jgi:hypothetical protein
VFKTSQFTRPVLIAVALTSLAGAPAMARQADLPVHQEPPVVHYESEQGQLPARVDGMGVQPRPQAQRPATASPVPAVPLKQGPPSDGGDAWLVAGIGGALLAGLLIAAAVVQHAGRRLSHPFRAASRV